MKKIDQGACFRCRFWWMTAGPRSKAPMGQCRRNPPATSGKRWPATESTEFCGEFRPDTAEVSDGA